LKAIGDAIDENNSSDFTMKASMPQILEEVIYKIYKEDF